MQSATLSPSAVTAASPTHAARNSLMTDTFSKHQLWPVTVKLGTKKGGSVGHAFINQQAKRMMYIHGNYPGDLYPSHTVSTEASPWTGEKLKQ